MEARSANANYVSILWRKYDNGILLLRHLGFRYTPYTWPTCKCPLQPKKQDIEYIWSRIQNTPGAKTTRNPEHELDNRLGGKRLLPQTPTPNARIKLVLLQPTAQNLHQQRNANKDITNELSHAEQEPHHREKLTMSTWPTPHSITRNSNLPTKCEGEYQK